LEDECRERKNPCWEEKGRGGRGKGQLFFFATTIFFAGQSPGSQKRKNKKKRRKGGGLRPLIPLTVFISTIRSPPDGRRGKREKKGGEKKKGGKKRGEDDHKDQTTILRPLIRPCGQEKKKSLGREEGEKKKNAPRTNFRLTLFPWTAGQSSKKSGGKGGPNEGGGGEKKQSPSPRLVERSPLEKKSL